MTGRLRWMSTVGCCVIGGLAALAVLPERALAAPSAPSDTQTNDEPGVAGTVGEVIVVARKRSENLLRVPISVSAASEQQLNEVGVRTALDLARISPSLIPSFTNSTSTATYTIRGIGVSDRTITASQSVTTYEDGVAIPHPEGDNASYFDLSQLEVLRGPQGTLYGRNTIGGAINLTTRGADFSGYHGFVGAEAGNYSDWRAQGAINIPIVDDKLAVRLAYQHWSRNGFGQSLVTGQRIGSDHDDDTARASVLYKPTDNFTIDARAEYLRIHENGLMTAAIAFDPSTAASPYGPIEAGFEAGGIPLSAANAGAAYATGLSLVNAAIARNSYSNSTMGELQSERNTVWHASVNMTYNVTPDIMLKSITGYHSVDDYVDSDFDGTPFQLLDVGAGPTLQPTSGTQAYPNRYPFAELPDTSDRYISEELNLSGNSFADRVKWLVGGYYGDDRGSGAQPVYDLPLVNQALAGFAAVQNSQEKWITDQTWGIFTQDDIELVKNLTFTVGARYSADTLNGLNSSWEFDTSTNPADPAHQQFACTAVTAPAGIFPTSTPCDISQHASYAGLSYLFDLSYQITPATMAYIKTSQGFRGGQLQLRAPAYAPTKPEYLRDYELGLKSELFDRRLRFDADLYDSEYTNLAVNQYVTNPITNTIETVLANAAAARIRGFESEFAAVPVHGLTLQGSLTYIETVYTNFPDDINEAGGVFNATGTPISGSGIGGTPKWAYTLGGRYAAPVGEGTLVFGLDWVWHSSTPFLQSSPGHDFNQAWIQSNFFQSRGLLNGRIDYNLPAEGLTVSLFATNLANTHYRDLTLPPVITSGVLTATSEDPIMWGLQIRKSFGHD